MKPGAINRSVAVVSPLVLVMFSSHINTSRAQGTPPSGPRSRRTNPPSKGSPVNVTANNLLLQRQGAAPPQSVETTRWFIEFSALSGMELRKSIRFSLRSCLQLQHTRDQRKCRQIGLPLEDSISHTQTQELG